MANASEKQAYISSVAATLKGKSTKGLFPSVIIAQAALESAWGKSLLASQYNNHFGMKKGTLGTDYGGWSSGQSVTLKTGEVVNGQSVTVNGVFRAYPSLADSVADHNGLFYKLSRYSDVCKAASPQAQIQAIKDGGYATATNYVSSVMSVINSNNLTKYDTPEYGYGTQPASASDDTNMAGVPVSEPQTENPVMSVIESLIDGDIATADEESDRAASQKKTIIIASVAAAVLIALIVAIVVLRKRKVKK